MSSDIHPSKIEPLVNHIQRLRERGLQEVEIRNKGEFLAKFYDIKDIRQVYKVIGQNFC
jgi:hypothetical protein